MGVGTRRWHKQQEGPGLEAEGWARSERTQNMYCISVTLDVSRLSGRSSPRSSPSQMSGGSFSLPSFLVRTNASTVVGLCFGEEKDSGVCANMEFRLTFSVELRVNCCHSKTA